MASGEYVLRFGKHKNERLDHVFATDPRYMLYLNSEVYSVDDDGSLSINEQWESELWCIVYDCKFNEDDALKLGIDGFHKWRKECKHMTDVDQAHNVMGCVNWLNDLQRRIGYRPHYTMHLWLFVNH